MQLVDRRQNAGSSLNLLFIEMDIDEREAHGQHKVWRCEKNMVKTSTEHVDRDRAARRRFIGIKDYQLE